MFFNPRWPLAAQFVEHEMKHCTVPLRRLESQPTMPEDEGFDWMDEAGEFPPVTYESYAREQSAEYIGRRIPGNY